MKTKKILFIIVTLFSLLQIPCVLAEETQADADSYASGTTSANAGVSISSDETSASAEAYADSSSNIASSITDVIASGQNVEAHSFSVSDNTGSIASSVGTAIGNLISLFSESTATGKNVYGEGGAVVIASQSSSVGVTTNIISLENGMYQITIQAFGDGTGDASGTVYTIAWTLDQLPVIVQVQPIVVQQRSFSGFVFGHGDTERYLHFKYQVATSNNTNITQRAKYWMETMTWTEYGLTQQEFEDKYINNSYYRNFTSQQYKKLQK